ncbi:MAG TPA: hypothetical protein VFH88_04580, partial [Candidatus Krumholzibacteria bacterium]|nr:hypothetical protein [Candidatus Krumholzibacteria bacterium]
LVELGGEARLEECVEPVPAVVPEPAEPLVEARREHSRAPERRSTASGIICPRCGWEEDVSAKFCSLCLHRFNKTEKLDFGQPDGIHSPLENPYEPTQPRATASFGERLRSLPRRTYVVAAVAMVILVAVLVALR